MAKYVVENVLIATTPRFITTQAGKRIGSFRVAENLPNGKANWFTVTLKGEVCRVFEDRDLGKGKRLDIAGDLHVVDWDNGERAGTSVEIELHAFVESAGRTHKCNCPNCAS